MAIWYPASGVTWKQYLQTQSFIQDITGEVRSSGKATSSSISEQTKQIVASNEQLSQQFGKAFDRTNETLNWGFNRVTDTLDNIHYTIQDLHSDFNYSMGLLLEQAQIQSALLGELVNRLDAIHNTLQNPESTQAREFYRRGCERLARGLLRKALEAFLEAERKNDTDFFIQFQIGQLYLYGINEDDNVVDLVEAKQHLLDAARYAKAESKYDPSFIGFAAESLLHASIAVYGTLAEKPELEHKPLLQEAYELAERSAEFNADLSEAHYHQAKYAALMGERAEVVQSLQRAIELDRNYAVKVDIDHAFDQFRSDVFALVSSLRSAAKERATSSLSAASAVIEEAQSWHPEMFSAQNSLLQDATQLFHQAKNEYSTNLFFGYLDAIYHADSSQLKAGKFINNCIVELRKTAEKDRANTESTLRGTKKISENTKVIDRAENLLNMVQALSPQNDFDSLHQAVSLTKEAYSLATDARNIVDNIDQERRRKAQNARERAEAIRDAGSTLRNFIIGAIISYIPLGFVCCLVRVPEASRSHDYYSAFGAYTHEAFHISLGIVAVGIFVSAITLVSSLMKSGRK